MDEEESAGIRLAREAAESQGHAFHPRSEYQPRHENALEGFKITEETEYHGENIEPGKILSAEENHGTWDSICQDYFHCSLESFAKDFGKYFEESKQDSSQTIKSVLRRSQIHLLAMVIKNDETLSKMTPDISLIEENIESQKF